jgi:hypothetical protein
MMGEKMAILGLEMWFLPSSGPKCNEIKLSLFTKNISFENRVLL